MTFIVYSFDLAKICYQIYNKDTKVEEEKITVSKVFLTHTHRDHVADLDRVKAIYPEVAVHVGSRELFQGAGSVEHGDVFDVGALKVSARLTWGHAKGGITYVIDGLATPIAVVGDAMFAGSMAFKTWWGQAYLLYHGLPTPNEGINQRSLKNWADVADKI